MARGKRIGIVLAVLVATALATAGLGVRSADQPYDDWDAFGHGLGPRGLTIPPEITLADHDFGAPLVARPFDIPAGRVSKETLAELFSESWSWPNPTWVTPHISISKTAVHLDISDLTLPIPADAAEHGLDARFKRESREAHFLIPLGQSLAWILSHFRELASATGHVYAVASATLIVDRDVPFRVLTEVLFTVGQSEFHSSFVVRRDGRLVVLAGVGPEDRGAWPPPFKTAMLDDGFVVSAKGMPVEKIAKRQHKEGRLDYDYAALNDAGNRWKAAAIENVPETAALITPVPSVRYQDVLRAQAALRTTDGQDLFPLAQFGVERESLSQ